MRLCVIVWDINEYWIVDTRMQIIRTAMHGYAAPLRDPFFFISDPKNKNCKIFYTKFKFYMGVAIERKKDSMNNYSSAFAYGSKKKDM